MGSRGLKLTEVDRTRVHVKIKATIHVYSLTLCLGLSGIKWFRSFSVFSASRQKPSLFKGNLGLRFPLFRNYRFLEFVRVVRIL